LKEVKKIKESLKKELKDNIKTKEGLEVEIVSPQNEAQKKNIQQNFANGTKVLDKIISSQRSCSDKTRLGYKPTFVKALRPQ